MGRVGPCAAVLACAVALLAGCGGSSGPNSNRDVKLRIGYLEAGDQALVGELYSQALLAAGYRLERHPGLDPVAAEHLLREDRLDVYAIRLDLAAHRLAHTSLDPGSDATEAHDQLAGYFSDYNQVLLDPTPFSGSAAVVMASRQAARLDSRTLTALRPEAGRLTVTGPPGCERLRGCLGRIEQVYGLNFRRFVAAPRTARAPGLLDGRFQVAVLASTDPLLAGGRLLALRDDRNALEPANIAPAVSEAARDRAGQDMARTLAAVSGKLRPQIVQQLNARIALAHEPLRRVAREFLRDNGLLSREQGGS